MRSMLTLRAVARLALQPPRVLMTKRNQLKAFSTSVKAYSSVASQLSECLNEEIRAEKELESQNLQQASFPGFKITTTDAEVRLTKKHNNEDILVVFNVNHSVDMGEDFESESSEAPPVPVALPPFTVEITKGNERLCFHLELCEGENGQYDFRVEEFYVAPSAKGTEEEDVASTVYASSGRYIDSNLHDLLFVRYLEERGLDAQFCKTLVQYATHYEHAQYVTLLHKIKAFVAN
ncbi:unnamed protein product, partial [Mesorhabditis belari]|uniref:Complement component 1 Q subcomponent-binding protein, mitochondrial n=1 Tax=Mesorhabditis belari TaxID=2138241 RepID=A0AAF3EBN5_9BILA